MSQKALDRHNRWRSKTVAFRMSPEENAQLDTAVRMCDLTKQNYIIQKLLNHDVIVKGNARVFKALRSLLGEVLTELKRIEARSNINLELMEIIRMMTDILAGIIRWKYFFKCNEQCVGCWRLIALVGVNAQDNSLVNSSVKMEHFGCSTGHFICISALCAGGDHDQYHHERQRIDRPVPVRFAAIPDRQQILYQQTHSAGDRSGLPQHDLSADGA